MSLPLQITFRQLEPSPALEARIRELAAKLERFSAHITRCHVIVAPLAGHQHHGELYEYHLDIALPDAVIAVHPTHDADHAHEDPYVALRDAFRAARRQLQDYERRHTAKRGTGLPATRGPPQ